MGDSCRSLYKALAIAVRRWAGCPGVANGAGAQKSCKVLGCYITASRASNDIFLSAEYPPSARPRRAGVATLCTGASGECRKPCNNGPRALGSRAEG